MPMPADEIENYIKSAFADAEVILTDLAGDNDHWKVEIISNAFAGKNRIEQHRMVHDALDGHLGGKLHALSISTRAK